MLIEVRQISAAEVVRAPEHENEYGARYRLELTTPAGVWRSQPTIHGATLQRALALCRTVPRE